MPPLHYEPTWDSDVGSHWPPVTRVSLTVPPHNGPIDGPLSMTLWKSHRANAHFLRGTLTVFDVSKKPLRRPTIANLIDSVNQYRPVQANPLHTGVALNWPKLVHSVCEGEL